MDDYETIKKMNVSVMDVPCSIEVCRRSNGKHFAVTSFSDLDAIITDGSSAEETIEEHSRNLSYALLVSFRRERLTVSGFCG